MEALCICICLCLSVCLCLCLCIWLSVSLCLGSCHHQMISFKKIYGLYGLEHHTLEINGDVANPGRPNNRTKIELLSWMDAERWVFQWLFFRQQLAPNHWFRNLFSTTMNWQILASQVPQPTCFWTYQSQAGTLCNTGQWPQPKPPWGRPPERSWPSQTLFNRRHQIISTLCHLCCIFFLIKPTEMSKNPEMLFKSGKHAKQIFGRSWDFGPTGLTPPSPNVGIFSVNLSKFFGKIGSNMP